MKDIELPPFQWGRDFPAWLEVRSDEEIQAEFTAYARAAIEADRAQRVPDGWKLVKSPITEEMHIAAAKVLIRASGLDGTPQRVLDALLASTPAQPAQQEPDCPRCKGSGEDPEGYFDQSRGPDGGTHDGPCRDCDGTGAAPQPVERKPITRNCPECQYSDSFGIADKPFCSKCRPTETGNGSLFYPLNVRHHGIRK